MSIDDNLIPVPLVQGGAARADPPARLQGHTQGHQGTERTTHRQRRGKSVIYDLFFQFYGTYLLN